jgi:RNA polymerase sigma-70 factor (ECF subfamily)
VRYRVADVVEAEDLTSDVLERALTHLGSYNPRKGAFSTWLFRIAHNVVVNHWRRRQRRQRRHVEWSERMEDLAADEPTPEQALGRQEEIARLMRCLDMLSPRQREVLSLRFAGRLSNREIARVLRMNERTVSVTVLRALRKLRRQLDDAEET